jgi:hypothetical protein
MGAGRVHHCRILPRTFESSRFQYIGELGSRENQFSRASDGSRVKIDREMAERERSSPGCCLAIMHTARSGGVHRAPRRPCTPFALEEDTSYSWIEAVMFSPLLTYQKDETSQVLFRLGELPYDVIVSLRWKVTEPQKPGLPRGSILRAMNPCYVSFARPTTSGKISATRKDLADHV